MPSSPLRWNDEDDHLSQEDEPLGIFAAAGLSLLVVGVFAGAIALVWVLCSRGLW